MNLNHRPKLVYYIIFFYINLRENASFILYIKNLILIL